MNIIRKIRKYLDGRGEAQAQEQIADAIRRIERIRKYDVFIEGEFKARLYAPSLVVALNMARRQFPQAREILVRGMEYDERT